MGKINRQQVFDKCGGKCGYCGSPIEFKNFQVDHMVPKCNTGHFKTYGLDCNDIENLMPTCRKCNHYKRGETVDGFRRLMSTLHKRLQSIYILEVAVNFGMAEVKPFSNVFYFETFKFHSKNDQ